MDDRAISSYLWMKKQFFIYVEVCDRDSDQTFGLILTKLSSRVFHKIAVKFVDGGNCFQNCGPFKYFKSDITRTAS